MQPTYYWHDYETWGANPKVDRPSQFAGVRTDTQLNIVGEPLVIYAKPPEDILPQPMACLVTGLTPQEANQKGCNEAEFIARIHQEFATPNTCSVGYNSLRFDDEVTRYTLYRNFYDPYEREWRNGNSRWDIIDMVRCTYALKPEGIEWPTVDGVPSFKLENLTQANHIDHGAAHDAYSDVAATIGLAKKIKDTHPGLYAHLETLKSKAEVAKLIQLREQKPLLHISSKFAAKQGCANIIAPIAMHPSNKNAVIVVVLDRDPTILNHLSAEQIREKLYTPTSELDDGEERLPIKCIHLNKCPILLTPKLLTPAHEARLGINKAQCERHWQQLRSVNIASKLQDVFAQDTFQKSVDPEQQLYDGFIKGNDKPSMQAIREAGVDDLQTHHFAFDDKRLNAMLPLYIARNYPALLKGEHKQQWQEHVKQSIEQGGQGKLSLQAFFDEIHQLKEAHLNNARNINILNTLYEYGLAKKAAISA